MLHIPFISISLHFTFITWARILLYMGIHVLYTQFYPFSDLFFNFTPFYVPLRVLYNFCKLLNSQTHPHSPWIRFVFWNMQKKNCTITPILQFCYNGLCAAILHFLLSFPCNLSSFRRNAFVMTFIRIQFHPLSVIVRTSGYYHIFSICQLA